MIEDDVYIISKSFSNHYRKIVGMVLENCSAGNETVLALEGNEVANADWSFIDGLSTTYGTVGQKVYIKKDDIITPSAANLTVNPILIPTGTVPNLQNLNACIGYFNTPYSIKLDFSEQYIVR